MPQNKRGQRTAGRPNQGSARTGAKAVPTKPAKREAAKLVAKPAAKHQVAKAAAKPTAKSAATKAVAKPVLKRKVAEAVVKPVKKHSKAIPAAKASTQYAVETPAIEPAIEPTFEATPEPTLEQWIATRELELAAEQGASEPVVEAQADELHAEPVETPIVDGWGTQEQVEPAMALEAVTAEVEPEVAAEVAPGLADSLFKPFVERRTTIRSLLERRLMDPSAKERRAESLAKECAEQAAANQPRVAAAAKARRAKIAAAGEDLGAAESAASANESRVADTAPPFVERRVSDRRAGGSWSGNNVEAGFRSNEQQNLFNETAVWMRKGGAILIGLNVLVVLVVLILWHSRPSQQVDLKEMQKANAAEIAEMKRATAASEVAAYASCLGSQTAQGILSQMKAGAHVPAIASLPPNAATRAQAAQIEFNVEKSTSVSAHVPVLFHLGVQNIGKSSALNTRVWGEVKVLDSGKEPDFKYDDAAMTKGAISPTDPEMKLVLYTTEGGLVVPLKEDDSQRVNSGAAYVVAYGKVVYEDIYGARHWAVFCHTITEPLGNGKHFSKCMSYNSTGVSEPASTPLNVPVVPQNNNASMTLPQVACQLPKEQKN